MSWRAWRRSGLSVPQALQQLWWAIPGTWRAELFVRELWLYGGWRKRRAALTRLHAYLDHVLRGGDPKHPPEG